MTPLSDSLTVLMCQHKKQPLLIPNTLVAEIISFNNLLVEAAADSDEQTAVWRGQTIKLWSLDRYQGEVLGDAEFEEKVLVLHKLKPQGDDKFYGLVIKQAPKMIKLNQGMLSPLEGEHNEAIFALANLEGVEVAIPNMAAFETQAFAENLTA